MYPTDPEMLGRSLSRALENARQRYAAEGPLRAHAIRLRGLADALHEYASLLKLVAQDLTLVDGDLRDRLGDQWWQHLRDGDTPSQDGAS